MTADMVHWFLDLFEWQETDFADLRALRRRFGVPLLEEQKERFPCLS